MEAAGGLLSALILGALVAWSGQTEYLPSETDICRYFKDGEVLRKPGTCTEAIICKNFISINYDECTTGMWDKDNKKCVSSSKDKYCSSPCSKSSPKYVSDPKNCQGWYECSGSTYVNSGLCSSGLYFDQEQQLCVYPSQTSCVAEYEICDVAPNGVPFWDEFNCHQYKECSNKGLNTETCPTGLYFDRQTGECIPKAKVNCYKHPYPEEVCGTRKLAIRNHFVPDQATCRGYFYCKDLGSMNTPDPEPTWGQCPDNLFFNGEQEACMDRNYVQCSEDRCDGIDSGKTLSSNPGCQHYLNCNNNSNSSEVYCGDGLYFDAALEECTATVKSYPACS